MTHQRITSTPPVDPGARLSVTLPAAMWNTVMASLAELPYRVAAPVLAELEGQLRLEACRLAKTSEPTPIAEVGNG